MIGPFKDKTTINSNKENLTLCFWENVSCDITQVMDMIHIETVIGAPLEDVWSALIDFAHWSDWNPFVSKIKGEAKTGNRLALKIFKKYTLHARLTEIVDKKILHFKGRGGPFGLLALNHTIELEPIDSESTRFTQTDTFSGWLAPIFFDLLEDHIKNGFEAMDTALKAHLEHSTEAKAV